MNEVSPKVSDLYEKLITNELTGKLAVEEIGNDGTNLSDLIQMLTTAYADLKANRDFIESQRLTLIRTIGMGEEWFEERLESGQADQDELEELGDIFGWETSKEVEIYITITATGTVSLPMGRELSEVETDIVADISTHSWSDFSISADVQSVELSEN